MLLYFDNQGHLKTKIPHGKVVRQGGPLDVVLCLDSTFFDEYIIEQGAEFKNFYITMEVIDAGNNNIGTAFVMGNVIEEFSNLVTFKKLVDSEVTYDLVDGKEYYMFECKMPSNLATSRAGEIGLVFTLYYYSENVRDLEDLVQEEAVLIFGKALVNVEPTYGRAKLIPDESLAHYKNLLAQIGALKANLNGHIIANPAHGANQIRYDGGAFGLVDSNVENAIGAASDAIENLRRLCEGEDGELREAINNIINGLTPVGQAINFTSDGGIAQALGQLENNIMTEIARIYATKTELENYNPVEANVDQPSAENLENIKIGDEVYDIPQTDFELSDEEKPGAEELGSITINGESWNIKKTDLTPVYGEINNIKKIIPNQASESNQLADKDFVNSSIATNTGSFRGTYQNPNDFPLTGNKLNDYVFLLTTASGDDQNKPDYVRFKWTETGWEYEYELNNSSFTAAQWATINSGLTSNDKIKVIPVIKEGTEESPILSGLIINDVFYAVPVGKEKEDEDGADDDGEGKDLLANYCTTDNSYTDQTIILVDEEKSYEKTLLNMSY